MCNNQYNDETLPNSIKRKHPRKGGKKKGTRTKIYASKQPKRGAPPRHHKLAPSLYECFYNTLTICSTFNVDTIIDMMLR
jgi:hypothetical protein